MVEFKVGTEEDSVIKANGSVEEVGQEVCACVLLAYKAMQTIGPRKAEFFKKEVLTILNNDKFWGKAKEVTFNDGSEIFFADCP